MTFGGIGALAGLPCLGVLIGGIIIMIVAVRRSSYKRRLQRQYSDHPPVGPPGYPPW